MITGDIQGRRAEPDFRRAGRMAGGAGQSRLTTTTDILAPARSFMFTGTGAGRADAETGVGFCEASISLLSDCEER